MKTHTLNKEYAKPDYYPVSAVNLTFHLEGAENQETKVLAKYCVERSSIVADDTPLELHVAPEVKLLSVKVNGWVFQYERTADSIILRGVPANFLVETVNLINTKDNTTGEGLYQAGDMLLTQNEPEGLRKIFPYFDTPKVLAPFHTVIYGNKEKYPVMLSNGNLVDQGEDAFGVHRKTYDLPFSIPGYLFALVAGKLSVLKDEYVTQSGRSVNLEIYAEEKDIQKCHHAMDSLKRAMKYDEEWYGYECDVDDYKIVATPYFNMGAMENKGLNIFNVSCVLTSPETGHDVNYEHVEAVIGHEYFHNWTGNRITCVDWRELGVKESITVRRDCLFSKEYCGRGLRKEIDDVIYIRSRQFSEDAGSRRHSVRPEEIKEPNNMYTSTVYNKGAEVYKMLEVIIGRDGFLKGMKHYAKKHDGEATRIEDLIVAMEETNNVDLHQFRHWFTQSGTPTVSISSRYDAKEKVLKLHIKQSCTPVFGEAHLEPFDIPFGVGLIGRDGEMQSRVLRITQPEEIFVFNNIPYKPALSLNRDFAPVVVKYDYHKGDLAKLMAHDTSLFARWDASQTFCTQVLLGLAKDVEDGKKLVLDQSFIKAFGAVLREKGIDKSLLAKMISFPGFAILENMSEVVNPHAICRAEKFALQMLAKTYRDEFERLYEENHIVDDEISFDSDSIARRAVANTALCYLVEYDDCGSRVFKQYEEARGMSDRYTALSLLSDRMMKHGFSRFAFQAIDSFFEQFKSDNNSIDRWFSAQVYSTQPGIIFHVKELMKHPDFDHNNPNRVRALVGAFTVNNPSHFHTEEGYALLVDFLVEYAPKNDIIASRLVTPLTDWKRYVPRLQSMMKKALEDLKNELQKVPAEKIRGTMEKIEKSLAQ